jgi:hypothetical protein
MDSIKSALWAVLDYTAAESAAAVAALPIGRVIVHPSTNRVPADCAACGAVIGVHRCDGRGAVMGVMTSHHITLCADKSGKLYKRCGRVFAVCHDCADDAVLVPHALHAK